ncbi:MAG: sporulation protein YlmC with PRC-barrel domain [Verrucomicrobiales bacterium]|jgi:sporulation protein YlmC with PRC-barrel domain
MMRSLKDIVGYRLDADGETVGKVKDLLFDDEKMAVRYIVANTGGWLSKQRVLISPDHLSEPDLEQFGNYFDVALSKEKIENAPLLEMDAPISRQYEEAFAAHYDHPPYWSGAMIWGYHGSPGGVAIPRDGQPTPPDEVIDKVERSHQRSFEEVRQYDIEANDGAIGVLDDLIVECDSWRLRYAIVDINGWIPGGKRMLDIDWLEGFDFTGAVAKIDLPKEKIKDAPDFDPTVAVSVDYQARLYNYYGKRVHWEESIPLF